MQRERGRWGGRAMGRGKDRRGGEGDREMRGEKMEGRGEGETEIWMQSEERKVDTERDRHAG